MLAASCAPNASTLAAPAQSVRSASSDARAHWERAWAQLERAERATNRRTSWKRRVDELRDGARERRITGLSQGDEQDLFRTRVLVWNLDRLEGRAALPVEPPRAAMDWIPAEAWFAARALPAGPARCEAMLLALDAAAPGELLARVDVAEQHAREELLVADPYGATELAARVDAIAPSAARYALHAWAAGQAGRASEVETAGRTRADESAGDPDEAVVRCALARLALAREDVVAARASIGAALARSSADAAVLAARLLVDLGEPRRARVLTRAWIDDSVARDVPSALWALACLAETPRPNTGGAPPRPVEPVR